MRGSTASPVQLEGVAVWSEAPAMGWCRPLPSTLDTEISVESLRPRSSQINPSKGRVVMQKVVARLNAARRIRGRGLPRRLLE